MTAEVLLPSSSGMVLMATMALFLACVPSEAHAAAVTARGGVVAKGSIGADALTMPANVSVPHLQRSARDDGTLSPRILLKMHTQ